MNPAQINEAELHAYVDGRLEPQRRSEIEAYLAENPADAKRVRSYQHQNAALTQLFDPALSEPVPSYLADFPRRTHAPSSRLLRHAAMAASLLMAASVGWLLRGTIDPPLAGTPAFAQRALVAHAVYAPEVLHPVEVSGAEEQHLSRWLSKRLGIPVQAPKLTSAGFELVGGRLLPDAPKPAAQFMYQNAAGARLTLYVTPRAQGRETAFRFEHSDRVGAFYWIDQGAGYALSGDVDRKALLQVAQLAYQSLNR